MAKAVYIGINNLAQKVKAIYIGINGTARKVVKGYIGVNGVARLFWEAVTHIKSFWLFFETINNRIFVKLIGSTTRTFTKINNGIGFFGTYNIITSSLILSHVIVISTDLNAVSFKRDDNTQYSGNSGIYVTRNGDTWYYASSGASANIQSFEPDCFINEYQENYPVADIVDELLDMIYINDFIEDYQLNNYYDTKLGDVEKTLKKGFAVFFYKHIKNQYHNNRITLYNALINNLDSIITRLIARIGNDNLVAIQIDFGNPDCVQVFHASYPSGGYGEQLHLTNKYSAEGYDYFIFETINIAKLYFTRVEKIRVDSGGNISYTTATATTSDYARTIGLYYYNGGFGSLLLSNVGLNF